MKCEKCKKATNQLFTLEKRKIDLMVCSKCLEKSIYKERRKLLKQVRRLNDGQWYNKS